MVDRDQGVTSLINDPLICVSKAEKLPGKPAGWKNVPEPEKLHYNTTETELNNYDNIRKSFIQREEKVWPEMDFYMNGQLTGNHVHKFVKV